MTARRYEVFGMNHYQTGDFFRAIDLVNGTQKRFYHNVDGEMVILTATSATLTLSHKSIQVKTEELDYSIYIFSKATLKKA